MSVEFKAKDFAYPLAILRLRAFLEKSQWYSLDELRDYQLRRLSQILHHANDHVPYYHRLFKQIGLHPSDIKNLDDLSGIPVLTKDILRDSFAELTADNASRFQPILNHTSGTSGQPVRFYLDKPSNVLEFCYYWRYWSWAGYKIRAPFAQFSIHHFADGNRDSIHDRSFMSNMLLLNSLQLSPDKIHSYEEAINQYSPRFLKGSPSTLFVFCKLLMAKRISVSFRAVFTTGETLHPYQKTTIEEALQCPILDSYGHMERTVAISQCLEGNYHVNDEYGILEIEPRQELSTDSVETGEMIGTSLHNFAMPFIRYKIGDLIETDTHATTCACRRGLPLIKHLHGREQDIIIARDGRLITNMFVVLQSVTGLQWFQFTQEEIDRFTLSIVKGPDFDHSELVDRLSRVKDILGDDVTIDIVPQDLEVMYERSDKYRAIASRVNIEDYL